MAEGIIDKLGVILNLKSTLGAEIKADAEKVRTAVGGMQGKLDELIGKYGKVALAGTAAAAGMLAIEAAAKDTNMAIARTSILMGEQDGKIRELVLANTNLKSSAEASAGAMLEFARAGVSDAKTLNEQTEAMKVLGKAIGVPANELAATLVPAMRGAGVSMDEFSGASVKIFDIWSHGGDIGEFSSFLQRSGLDAREAGLNFDDLTNIYAKFVREGVPARKAVSLIGDAIQQVNDREKKGAEASEKYAETLTKLNKASAEAAKIDAEYARELSKLVDEQKEAAESLERDYLRSMEDQTKSLREAQHEVDTYAKAIREVSDTTEETTAAQEDLEAALKKVRDIEEETTRITEDHRKAMADLAQQAAETAANLATSFSDSLSDLGINLDDAGESAAKYQKLLSGAGLSEEEIGTLTANYTTALEAANAEREKATTLTEEYQKAMAAAAGDTARQNALTTDYKEAMTDQQAVIQQAIETADTARDRIIADYEAQESAKVASVEAQIDAEKTNLDALKALYKDAEDSQKESIEKQIDEKEKQIDALEEKARLPSGEASAMEDYMEALKRQSDLQEKIKVSTDEYNASFSKLTTDTTAAATEATDSYTEALEDQNTALDEAKKASTEALNALAKAADPTEAVAKATAEYYAALGTLADIQAETARIQEDHDRESIALKKENAEALKDLQDKYAEDQVKQDEVVSGLKDDLNDLFDIINAPRRTVQEILKVGDLGDYDKAKEKLKEIKKAMDDLTPVTGIAQEAMVRLGVAGGPAFSAVNGVVASLGTLGAGVLVYRGASSLWEMASAMLGLGKAAATVPAAVGEGAAGLGPEMATAGSMAASSLLGAITAGLGLGMAGVWVMIQTGLLDAIAKLGKELEVKFPAVFDLLKVPAAPLALLGSTIIDTVTGHFDQIPKHWSDIWDQVVKSLTNIIIRITGSATSMMTGVRDSIDGAKTSVYEAFKRVLAVDETIIRTMADAGKNIMAEIVGGVKNSQELMRGAYITVLTVSNTILNTFVDTGKNIIKYISDGIKETGSMIYTALLDAFGPLADLLPHSPAREGPLSQPVNWEGYIVDPFAAAMVKFNKYKSEFTTSLVDFRVSLGDMMTAASDAAKAVSGMTDSKKQYYDWLGNYVEPESKEEKTYNPAGYVDMGGYASDFNITSLSRAANSVWETGTEVWDEAVKAWKITYTNGVIRWFETLADDAQAIKEDLGSTIPERWKEAIEARDLQAGGLEPTTVSGEVSPEAGYQLVSDIITTPLNTNTSEQSLSNEILGKIADILTTIAAKTGTTSNVIEIISSATTALTQDDTKALQAELLKRGVY